MYQALYRKYRPRSFSDVAGQEHITETLRRQLISGRLTHAYLFVGTRGTGKTTCAKILSRAVNCLSPVDGDPCNKCTTCLGIENGSILDVLELDAASNNGVDSVRALREEAIYSPATTLKRVYIIDEVHMLSTQAFNALLKILEEPPEHLIFILATTELHKVPATILSRCQRFSFKRLTPATIATRLTKVAQQEGFTLTADAADKLASLADGSMRDGISLLDQCASDTNIDLTRVLDTIGLAGQQELVRLADSISHGDVASALGVVGNLFNDGKDMASLLGDLVTLFRDLLLFKLSTDSPLLCGNFDRTQLSGLSPGLHPERLFYCIDIIRETVTGFSRGGGTRLAAEMCIIRMCDDRLSGDVPALLSRISKLEENPVRSVQAKTEAAAQSDTLSVADATDTEAAAQHDTGAVVQSDVVSTTDAEDSPPVISEPPVMVDTDEPGLHIPDPEPEQEQETPERGFWDDILDLLKNDPPVYALLSESTKIHAELQNSILIIRTGDIFSASSIESGMLSAPLRAAAEKVLGHEVIIRVEIKSSAGEPGRANKLDDLRKFGIVQYE